METSSALKTDHYELTMLAAALGDGTAGLRAVFEVFGRKLAGGRRYGVVGGLGRLLDEIDGFRFTDEQLASLDGQDFLDRRTLDFLADYRFSGDVIAYQEGELYFPGSPVLIVEGTFGEAVLLETLVLSVLNHDSAIASAAARMVDVADGRRLIEMGGRRTHEEAAVAAARTAYLTGFDTTSNLEAGHRHGIPTTGTAAHAFTLAHRSERAAFASQMDALGTGTTLLVDTYDITDAIRTGVELAVERGATGPGAIRIDSGDLVVEATNARKLLDDLGAVDTRIVVSSDLDEYLIEDLVERGAPIDGFGVGTKLVTGSGHPTASFVYKLVAIAEHDGPDAALRHVAKKSASKLSVGGRKRALRRFDDHGFAAAEDVTVHDEPFAAPVPAEGVTGRPLQVVAVRGGLRVHHPDLSEIRDHHRRALAELHPVHRQIVAGGPAFAADPRPTVKPQPSRSEP